MSNIVQRFSGTALAALLTFSVCVPSASVFFSVAAAEDEQVPDIWSYEQAYKANLTGFCPSGPWKSGEGSVIKAVSVTYPKIGIATSDTTYREAVKAVGGDMTGIEELISKSREPAGGFQFGTDVKLASETYKERMNGIFACAQINFKIRTHESLLKTIKGEKADSGNTAKKIEEQTKMLRKELGKRHCADRTSTEGKANVMMKKMVLNQSTMEYCNYRSYLQYLRFNAQYRMSAFVEAETKRRQGDSPKGEASSSSLGSAEDAGNAISDVVVSISQEIEHTREVFPQALVAYNEFERTYASHVVMLFVLEDYALLRDSLKKVMNPLGQVIYKASNAESPKSP